MYKITILSKFFGLKMITFTVPAEYFHAVKAILAGEYHYNLYWERLSSHDE